MRRSVSSRATSGWDPACDLALDKDLGGDIDVTDRAPGGRADEIDRLTEADRPRSRELVDLAAVAVFGQRLRGDLGDVLGVDERRAPVAGRQGQDPGADSGQAVDPAAVVADLCSGSSAHGRGHIRRPRIRPARRRRHRAGAPHRRRHRPYQHNRQVQDRRQSVYSTPGSDLRGKKHVVDEGEQTALANRSLAPVPTVTACGGPRSWICLPPRSPATNLVRTPYSTDYWISCSCWHCGHGVPDRRRRLAPPGEPTRRVEWH